MTPEIAQRLVDFEKRHKPDSRQHLALFREEIVHLHHKGYSLKVTFEYLKEQGVSCSLRTFERWVKDAIDFASEMPPPVALAPTTQGDSLPRAADAPPAARPRKRRKADAQRSGTGHLPELPLFQHSKEAGPIHSSTNEVQESRQRALARARELREEGFRSPVERALDPRQTNEGR